jgi:hypothetical protein
MLNCRLRRIVHRANRKSRLRYVTLSTLLSLFFRAVIISLISSRPISPPFRPFFLFAFLSVSVHRSYLGLVSQSSRICVHFHFLSSHRIHRKSLLCIVVITFSFSGFPGLCLGVTSIGCTYCTYCKEQKSKINCISSMRLCVINERQER